MRRLSVAETTELAERLADLAGAGLPLPPGLRAAAEDASTNRLAAALRIIAADLENGSNLEEALGAGGVQMQAYVQGAVRAGIRTGEMARVLTQMVQADRHARAQWRELRLALAYPVLLLALMGALALFVTFVIMPAMEEVFTDFDTELPLLTSAIVSAGRAIRGLGSSRPFHVFSLVACGLAATFLFIALLRRLAWRLADHSAARGLVYFIEGVDELASAVAMWPQRILTTFPLLGAIVLWTDVAQWARLLAVLVESRVPLPEALALTGRGVRSANVGDLSQRLGEDVRRGGPLSQRVQQCWWLPASLAPILAWGEKSGQLAEALRTAADMFEGRVQLRATLIKQLAPPVMFVVVAGMALVLVAAMFAPLVSLIQNLV